MMMIEISRGLDNLNLHGAGVTWIGDRLHHWGLMNHGEKIRTTCVRVHYSTWAKHQEVLFAEMIALNLHIIVYRACI